MCLTTYFIFSIVARAPMLRLAANRTLALQGIPVGMVSFIYKSHILRIQRQSENKLAYANPET